MDAVAELLPIGAPGLYPRLRVEAVPGLSDQQRTEVQGILAEHRGLMERYRAALPLYAPGDPQTIFAVDTQVRGIDRGLNQRIDALAEGVLSSTRAEAQDLRLESASEYGMLRTLVSVVAVVVIALSGVLAWRATRAVRAARAT
jgi:hypothetical protein